MSSAEITAGTVEPLEVFVLAAAGGPLTGSSNIRVQIRAMSGADAGKYLDFNDGTFKVYASATTPRAALVEVDATNDQGTYARSGGVNTTGWAAGVYSVRFMEITTSLTSTPFNLGQGEIRIVVATPSSLSGRIPANLVNGRMDASVGEMQANTITDTAVAASAVTELQAGLPAAIDTTLSASHGSGGWTTATGFAVPGSAMTLTSGERNTLAAVIDALLITNHGAGGWVTATGFAVAGDAMALTSGERTTVAGVINTTLGTAHGVGSWATATGFAVAGDAMTLTGGERSATAAAAGASSATAVWAAPLTDPGANTRGRELHRIYQLGFNRLELAGTGSGVNTLYADDGSTPMITFQVRDVAGGALILTTGSPSRRGAAVTL